MNTDIILQALEIMWKGMLGIFVTIVIVMIGVFILGRIGSGADKKDKKDKQDQQ